MSMSVSGGVLVVDQQKKKKRVGRSYHSPFFAHSLFFGLFIRTVHRHAAKRIASP